MTRISLTGQVHRHLLPHLSGDTIAIDATAGNGHDSLFLAANIGENGRLYAFDIQRQAIENSRKRLAAEGLSARVTLIQTGHEHMTAQIPEIHHGRVNIIMFNLGYLPCADKSLITTTATTIKALQVAPNGLVYGLTSDSVLFVFDPKTRKVVHTAKLEQWGSVPRGDSLFMGTRQRVYAQLSKTVLRFDPETFQPTVVVKSPVEISVAGPLLGGRLYFGSGTHLWSYELAPIHWTWAGFREWFKSR